MADSNDTPVADKRQTEIEKRRECSRRWKQKNKAKVAAYGKAYCSKRKAELAAFMREYRAKNKDYFREVERARRKGRLAYQKEWFEKNKEKRRASQRACSQRYTARKKGAKGNVTKEEWAQIVSLCNGKCFWCGKSMDVVTQDHLIPLSKGGSHTPDNVVPACRSCNCKKSDRDPLEFLSDVISGEQPYPERNT